MFTFAIREARGNEVPMRTPMACLDSTSPREPTCPPTSKASPIRHNPLFKPWNGGLLRPRARLAKRCKLEERWHQTLKNRVLLENYYLPGDLEAQVDAFVEHYNHRRYHESLGNLTPADVYFGRGQTILLK